MVKFDYFVKFVKGENIMLFFVILCYLYTVIMSNVKQGQSVQNTSLVMSTTDDKTKKKNQT